MKIPRNSESIAKNILLSTAAISVIILVIMTGSFLHLFNILPTCPNGAIAPYGDPTKCGGNPAPTVTNGIVNTTPYGSCSDPNTHWDSNAQVCLANTTPAQACFNSGGTWNSATSVCTLPPPTPICSNGSYLNVTGNTCVIPTPKSITPTNIPQMTCFAVSSGGSACVTQSTPQTVTPNAPIQINPFVVIFAVLGIGTVVVLIVLKKKGLINS